MPSFDSIWVINIWSVIFGLAAIAVSIIKAGRNQQAVRAVGFAGIFMPTPLLGLAAAAWAVADFLLPIADIRITAKSGKSAKK
jgi:hypothetical protein